jgi:hypothetical protein
MKMDTTSQSPGGNEQQKPTPQDHLHALQDDAQAALAGIKEQGATQFEHYRDSAAQQIETLAQSAQTAADQIEDDGGDALGLSHYVTDIAQSMTTLASDMRGKSIDQLLQQAGKLARDNPALFITGSVALGFGLSRFLKASSASTSSTTREDSPPSSNTHGQAADPLSDSGQAPGGQPGLVDRPVSSAAGNDVVTHGNAIHQQAPGQLATTTEFDLPADGKRQEGMSKGELQ